MLRGALAAAVTPLSDGGAALDEDAVRAVRRLPRRPGRLDGILALGTTGEGILLSVARARAGRRALHRGSAGPAPGRGPRRRPDDGRDRRARRARGRRRRRRGRGHRPAVLHLRRGGALPRTSPRPREASEPAPVLPLRVQGRGRATRSRCRWSSGSATGAEPRGLKVSNQPFEAVEPYLLEGLDVFVGAESLVDAGSRARRRRKRLRPRGRLPGGRSRRERRGRRRAALERFPFQAALKPVLGCRGVPVARTCVAPLRTLTAGGARGARAHGSNRRSRRRRDRRRASPTTSRSPKRERRRALRQGRGRVRRDRQGDGRRAPAVLDGAPRCGSRRRASRFFAELGPPLFEQVGYLFLATTEDGRHGARGARRELQAGARRTGRGRRSVLRRRAAHGRRPDGAVVCREDGVADPARVTRRSRRRRAEPGRRAARVHGRPGARRGRARDRLRRLRRRHRLAARRRASDPAARPAARSTRAGRRPARATCRW